MKNLTYQLVIAYLLLGLLCATASAQLLRKVALEGDPAPGTPIGSTFTRFGIFGPIGTTGAALNAAGHTAFYAETTSGGGTGIWSEGFGALELVARTTTGAPGTPDGTNFNGFKEPLLNSAGQTAFLGTLPGSTDRTPNYGIWSEGSGTLGLVAREGTQAPGTPDGVNFGDLRIPVFNSAGQTAFRGFLTGAGVDSTNSSGIWSEGSGSLTLIARAGDQANGAPSGVNFTGFRDPVLNSLGQTAFEGFTSVGVGIWSERSGTLELVTHTGDSAPGMPFGVNFNGFETPVFNSAGNTAFIGSLTGNGVESENNESIWSEGSGPLTLVAREGDQAPGLPSGVNFGDFSTDFNRPVLNSAGQSAFLADLVGSDVDNRNARSVWSEGTGTLALVARAGERAPGTPAGVKFGSFQNLVLNSAGQTAFMGHLSGSGVDSLNNSGIWAEDRAGVLKLIVREGDQLEVAPGDSRTIKFLVEFIGDSGNDDGRISGFNDLGQLAFRAAFADNSSGIFVSNLATLPEPHSLLLLASAAVSSLLRVRSR